MIFFSCDLFNSLVFYNKIVKHVDNFVAISHFVFKRLWRPRNCTDDGTEEEVISIIQ